MKLSRIFNKQLKLIDKIIKKQVKDHGSRMKSLELYRESVLKLRDDALKGEKNGN